MHFVLFFFLSFFQTTNKQTHSWAQFPVHESSKPNNSKITQLSQTNSAFQTLSYFRAFLSFVLHTKRTKIHTNLTRNKTISSRTQNLQKCNIKPHCSFDTEVFVWMSWVIWYFEESKKTPITWPKKKTQTHFNFNILYTSCLHHSIRTRVREAWDKAVSWIL